MSAAIPLPGDFLTFAPGKSLKVIAAHYGVGTTTAFRWREQTGVARAPKPRGRPHKPIPLPTGFKAIAPSMTMRQLRERYGRSADVIRRWCHEADVDPRRPLCRRPGPKPLMVTKGVHRDCSHSGQAAEFLRKFGPVYRCGPKGRPLARGLYWNRCGHVLTDEELIARAERLGWDPDAWRKVA